MLVGIKYSDHDIKFIQEKLKSESFCSNSWSDDDLSSLKEKIKKHYHSIQNTICPYCKQKLNSTHGRHWDIEHIIPRSLAKNFMFEPQNLCMSCVDCNSEKSNKKVTTSTAQVKYPTNPDQYLIIHPHFDDYEKNLLVVEAGLFYYPLKEKGRKTIEVCGLNRFYEFAGFGEDEDVFEKITRLNEVASRTDDKQVKSKILEQVIALALKGILTNKRLSTTEHST